MYVHGTLRKTAPSIWTPFFVVALLVDVARAEIQQHWDFEIGQPGEVPAGFLFARTGNGRVGQWILKVEPDAPSGRQVLAQVDADATDFRFPLAVADEPSLANLWLSVKCKPVSGAGDQACGLVFRYQDENNYYLARANALEQNVRLYRVVNGGRRQLAGWSGGVASRVWHALRVEARGERFIVFWDGQQIMNATDATFGKPGKVGVWTKADSVTYFDDLHVEPLGS